MGRNGEERQRQHNTFTPRKFRRRETMLVRVAEDDWTIVESEQQGQHAYVL